MMSRLLSQLSGSGGFTNARVNNAIDHSAFDYIESRWGPNSIRLFLDALVMPRVSKTCDAVFDLAPEDFDIAFRGYALRRFGQGRALTTLPVRRDRSYVWPPYGLRTRDQVERLSAEFSGTGD